jgi:protoporphyrinogen oxidase
MRDCIVIGGGLAGMAAAWRMARQGLQVTLLEKDDSLGGLASSFEQDGRIFPLGYHHILGTDDHLLAFLARLDLLRHVRWKEIDMAFSMDGGLHRLGGVSDLVQFPLRLRDKARLAALIASAWMPGSEDDDAGAWVRRVAGKRVADDFFDRLTHIKFGTPTDDLSAAWLRARMRAQESSCRYGSMPDVDWVQTLVHALTEQLRRTGVEFHTDTAVGGLKMNERTNRVAAVTLETGEELKTRSVISAIAPPLFMRLFPDYPDKRLSSIRYTGVVSTVLATHQDVPLDAYWTNFVRPYYSFGGIFRLDVLNSTMGHPGDRILNFCTHVSSREEGSFLLKEPSAILDRYLQDFHTRFGIRLEPTWSHTTRVPYYSPVFVRGYENPPVQSPSLDNLFFAGNYRSFPVLATTGSAMGSGWEAGAAVCRALDATPTPLRDVEAA